MKRKLNSVYVLFAVLLAAFLQISNSGNPNNGFTGAPPSGNTCSSGQGGCHSGPSGQGDVTITGLPSTVAPLGVYPITVTLERANNSVVLGGFQLVAQLSNNSNAGELDNPGASSTVQFTGGKYYFEHQSAPNFSGNTLTFTCDWTAPSSASGPITMYVAANFADGSGSTSGDGISTATATTTLSGGGAIALTVTGTNVSCAGGSNGTASVSASGGGGGPYTFTWSNNDTGPTITGLTAGTYTVTASNSSGGSGTGSVTITQPTPVVVILVDQTNISCNSPLGSATVDADGGTGNHIYSWSTGQSGATATLPAGTHNVTATDALGCTATTSVTITSNTTAPTAEAGPPATISCASAVTTLNGAGSSTGGSFSYLWTTADGNIVSGATTLTPTVNAIGTYSLTVSNGNNGCTSSDLTTVIGNTTPPNSNAGADGQLTCASTSLVLNGSSSSSGAGFTYLWTTANGNIVSGANTPTPTVNQAGTYCLTVTNAANGCTAADCASVANNTTPPLANAGSAPPLTCTTTVVTLNGSSSSTGSNFSYLWTTTNGNIVSGATTLSPVVSLPAIYVLTVTNSTNGCTASSSVTVTSNTTQPTASAGPNRALNCNNTSVVLDGSGSSQGGNFNYLWSGPGIVSGGTTPTPTVNAAGNYIILVTNTGNGCTRRDTASVAQTPALVAAIPASQNVACNGANTGSATAAGSGGKAPYSYAWSNSATTAQITNIAAGTYTVIITDADNCTASASRTITQPPVLNSNATATGETSVGGNNGMATASPTGGVPNYNYLWKNASGTTVGTTATITGLAPGNYSVTVTDANNCTAAQTVTVASFSCGGIGVSMAATNPSCNGGSNGSASATPMGGNQPYSYAWSNGMNTSSISGLAAGSYMVSISDGNGCLVTGNVSLVAPTALNLNSQVTGVACNGGSTGSASVTASGGTPTYTFSWSNGGMGAAQSNLAAGSYTAIATDANGCTANIQVTITQPAALAGNLTASGETGVNTNDGTASVAMSGGVAPYTYSWNNGATTSSIAGLAPGSYCVSVTDSRSCIFTSCATVVPFGCAGQALTLVTENVGCAGDSDGSAQVTAAGFQAPLSYAWANALGTVIGTGSSIANLAAGTYSVSVSGADGCASSQTVSIVQPAVLGIQVLTQNNLECTGGADGSLSVSGTGGTPGYDFTWSNGATTHTITNLVAGVYEVSISDENDCTASASLEISVLPDVEAPTALAVGTTVSLSSNGTASITPQMIDNGSTDNCGVAARALDITVFDCNDLGENTVTLTVTDAAGNASTATATVVVLDEIDPEILCPDNITVDNGSCAVAVEYATPVATDNCGTATVSLVTGPESGAVFNSGTTTVSWAAMDGQGNLGDCSFTVTVVSDFSLSTAFAMPTCNGDSNGTATATAVGGTPPYSYAWDDPANQQTATATGLSAGAYEVSVTDAEGCMFIENVQVTEPDLIVINVDSVGFVDVNQLGFIDITMEGGTGGYGFEWTFNGDFFSNEEDLSGLVSGFYLLQVSDISGCVAEMEIYVPQVDATLEEALSRRIGLTPNPSSGRVFVNFDLGKTMPVSFQMLDLSGRPVTAIREAVVSKESIELDLMGTASGVYFLRAIVGESVVVKRLVIGR